MSAPQVQFDPQPDDVPVGGIFYDVSNVECSLNANGLRKKSDYRVIDPWIREGLPIDHSAQSFFFIGVPPKANNQVEQEDFGWKYDREMRKVTAIRFQGHIVETNPPKTVWKNGDGITEWNSNIDNLMTTRIMEFVERANPKFVVIVSADKDFSHVAQSLRRKGIWVICVVPVGDGRNMRTIYNDVRCLEDIHHQLGDLPTRRIVRN